MSTSAKFDVNKINSSQDREDRQTEKQTEIPWFNSEIHPAWTFITQHRDCSILRVIFVPSDKLV